MVVYAGSRTHLIFFVIFLFYNVLLRTLWLSTGATFRVPIMLAFCPVQRRLCYLFKSWAPFQPQLLPFMIICFLLGLKKKISVERSLMVEFFVLLIFHNSYTNSVSNWSIDQSIKMFGYSHKEWIFRKLWVQLLPLKTAR